MRTLGYALFAAAAFLPAVAQAEDSTMSAAAPAATVQSWDPNKIECMYLYHESSVVHKPICMKAAEWVANRERTQRNFREIQVRSLVAPR